MQTDKIPILKSTSYGRYYFKHEPPVHSPATSTTQYFGLYHRCLWKNFIKAHRLDFYMVFIVTAGEGVHTLGIRKHIIKENMLCFVGPRMINSWQSSTEDHRGFFCAFADDFFNTGRENKQFLAELPFFQPDGNAVLHLTDEQTSYYLSLFTAMQHEHQNRNEYSDDILRSHLHILLTKALAHYHTEELQPHVTHPGMRLTKAFTALYMRDFKGLNGKGSPVRLKRVADYADELGVTQNYLNDTVKAVTGRSAGQLIKDQLIRQATMCLTHSSKSIGEIAYLLGYDDPSYFARYYKSQTGRSPSEYRDKL